MPRKGFDHRAFGALAVHADLIADTGLLALTTMGFVAEQIDALSVATTLSERAIGGHTQAILAVRCRRAGFVASSAVFVAAFEIDTKLPTALGFDGAFVCAKPFGAALVAWTNQIALAAVAKIR